MDIEPEISSSKNRTSVIDVIARDPKTSEVVLVMNEPNEWDGSDEQLLSLQERFNAYVSFLLDGEIGLACDRTNGSEIVRFKVNSIIALRSGIWKSLESRLAG